MLIIETTPLEYLKAAIVAIKEDIRFYQRKNRPGVYFSDEYRAKCIADCEVVLKGYETAIALLSENADMRLVIQTKHDEHGHQVVRTDRIYMRLTEEQQAVLSKVFDTSDNVISFIFPTRKKKVGRG